jgi:hypothetical protein
MSPAYAHTQRAPFWLLLAALAAAAVVGGSLTDDRVAQVALPAAATVTLLLAACFCHLTIADAGDHLAVRFGPLPLFGTKVRYDAVRAVRPARSRWIDGWGVHWVPGRGWTFNLWGRDCVEVVTGRGTLRLGTDDRAGLCAFLGARTGVTVAPRDDFP